MHTLKITSAAVHFFKTSSSSSSSFIYIALLLFSPNFSGSVSHQHAKKKEGGPFDFKMWNYMGRKRNEGALKKTACSQ